jgi:hypothetical protein
MIVRLYDGREGELVGWVRATPLADRPGYLPGRDAREGWLPEIVVVEPESIRTVLHVAWQDSPRGVPWPNLDQARAQLALAVALAGLCFWPDPDGRDLDLAPWVREVYEQAVIAEWRWRRSVETYQTGATPGTQFAMNRLRRQLGNWLRPETEPGRALYREHTGAPVAEPAKDG